MMNMPRPTLLPMPSPKASTRPIAMAAMITTRAIPEGTRNVSRKSERIRPRRSRAYVLPTRSMTRYARRRASPDFVAIIPNRIAPNRNQGVSSAKPPKATSNLTTRNAQKRKHPIRPVRAWASASVIQATIMNEAMARACLTVGSKFSGANHRMMGKTTQRILPVSTRQESRAGSRAATWPAVSARSATTSCASSVPGINLCACSTISHLAQTVSLRAQANSLCYLSRHFVSLDHDFRLDSSSAVLDLLVSIARAICFDGFHVFPIRQRNKLIRMLVTLKQFLRETSGLRDHQRRTDVLPFFDRSIDLIGRNFHEDHSSDHPCLLSSIDFSLCFLCSCPTLNVSITDCSLCYSSRIL